MSVPGHRVPVRCRPARRTASPCASTPPPSASVVGELATAVGHGRRAGHRHRRQRVARRPDHRRRHLLGGERRARRPRSSRRCARSPASPCTGSATGRSCCTSAARSRSQSKVPLRTRDDLSMAYTPGVGRVSLALAAHPEDVAKLTIKGNAVAVVTDGSAVLGLGNIGPGRRAAGDGGQGGAVQALRRHRRVADLPRHPGHRRDRAGRAGDLARLRRHQPRGHLGAALLRDRAAAARRARHPGLPRRPARHRDRRHRRADQRAALRGQAAGRRRASSWPAAARPAPRSSRCCSPPAPSTSWCGTARASWRPSDTAAQRRPSARWPRGPIPTACTGDLHDALRGADVFIGVSAPERAAGARGSPTWPPSPVVFALANPDPEVDVDAAQQLRRRAGHRAQRLPEPDQQRAGLPRRVPRPARRAGPRGDDRRCCSSAADALAHCVSDEQLNATYIVPSVFDPAVPTAVAAAVARRGRAAPASAPGPLATAGRRNLSRAHLVRAGTDAEGRPRHAQADLDRAGRRAGRDDRAGGRARSSLRRSRPRRPAAGRRRPASPGGDRPGRGGRRRAGRRSPRRRRPAATAGGRAGRSASAKIRTAEITVAVARRRARRRPGRRGRRHRHPGRRRDRLRRPDQRARTPARRCGCACRRTSCSRSCAR